jgi:1,4-alpha-glucan branching enzyme
VRDLNRVYQSERALYEVDFDWKGFEWIDFRDVDQSIVSFVRRGRQPEEAIVVVANFTPVVRTGYRLGVPSPGFYRELLNSDSEHYWGSNMGNAGGLPSDPIPWQGQPHSVLLTVPPLAVVYLKPELHSGDG